MLNTGNLIFNKKITEAIFHLRVKVSEHFSALPGQFVNIRVDDSGWQPLLRRPFSIFDFKEGFLDILYKVIGEGTKKLSEKKKDDKIDFIGPVGNTYIDFLPEEIKGKKICLVAGGTGFASIHFFAKWLTKKKIKFSLFYGAKNKKEIVNKFINCFNAFIATDDGSYGKKGFVTDLLRKENCSEIVIFCCGPLQMLKTIQKIKSYKKFASFESYMGCANGVCLSCVIMKKYNDNFDYVRVCREGPVFNLDEIII